MVSHYLKKYLIIKKLCLWLWLPLGVNIYTNDFKDVFVSPWDQSLLNRFHFNNQGHKFHIGKWIHVDIQYIDLSHLLPFLFLQPKCFTLLSTPSLPLFSSTFISLLRQKSILIHFPCLPACPASMFDCQQALWKGSLMSVEMRQTVTVLKQIRRMDGQYCALMYAICKARKNFYSKAGWRVIKRATD